MRIKQMTAVFGKLSGQTLTCAPGLNVIQAPNEGGKSTWAAFLRAMFYGIDLRSRDKKGCLADKNRYQPWTGAAMEGTLELEWQGRSITLRRGPRGGTPFGAFSAVYTATGEPVPGLTAGVCGEFLLGVGREVYERSAFVGPGTSLAVGSAPELERRIAALVSSGEEEVSFSQAEGRLREWLNRRRVNKSVGRIPQLEAELSQVREARQELEQLTGALNALAAEEAALRRKARALEEELELHKKLAQQETNSRFRQALQELEQAQAALDALEREKSRFGPLPSREALKEAQGNLACLKALDPEIRQGEEALAQAEAALERARQASDPRFSGLSGGEVLQRAEQAGAEYRRQTARSRACRRRFPALQLLGLAALAALAAGEFFRSGGVGPLTWAGAGVYLLFAAASVVSLSAGRRAGAAAERILEDYGVRDPEELTELARRCQERSAQAGEAAQQVKLLRETLAERRARRERDRQALMEFVRAFAPEATDLFGCSAALSRALSLEEREGVARARLEGAQRLCGALQAQGGRAEKEEAGLPTPARTQEETAALLAQTRAGLERAGRALNVTLGRQKAAGDPAALAARQEALEGELARRTQEYQAISLAMEALGQANSQLQERFSPKLNRLAGQYLARLTGERYTALTLDRELEAAAAGPDTVLPRSALYLSRGTVDQIYLAVRLAVCTLCLQEFQVPLVLDDALSAFDDRRMERALDLLLELSQERQILLFTGQGREQAYLRKKPGVSIQTLP